MHKIHVIQRQNGSVLVVAVMNPGTPPSVVELMVAKLKRELNAGDKVLVVPYATAVVVTNETLRQSLRAWWLGRKLRKAGEGS